MTIGPHEGQELDLMLAGTKKLAAFGDALPESGSIPEEIIPENAFAPYIRSGRLKRFEQITASEKSGDQILHVCFTLPEEEWRAHAYLWLRKMIHEQSVPYDDACDIIFGRLLGYSEDDIVGFRQR